MRTAEETNLLGLIIMSAGELTYSLEQLGVDEESIQGLVNHIQTILDDSKMGNRVTIH